MLENDKSYIILLIKKIHTIFCYYSFSESTINQFETLHGPYSWNNSQPELKLFYVEDGVSKIKDTIILDPLADNWFINIPEDDKDIYVKYGRLLNNNFIPVLDSNIITTPRDYPSGDTNLYFINIELDKKNVIDYPVLTMEGKIPRNPGFEEYMKKLDIKEINFSHS